MCICIYIYRDILYLYTDIDICTAHARTMPQLKAFGRVLENTWHPRTRLKTRA